MPPPSSNDITISNYDVLADQVSNPINSDESDIGLSLAAHSYHVGNNRLEVLCNIHNQAFSDHQAKGDEFNSASIVEKIMDIVQNQCVPKGRFLQRSTKGEWSIVQLSKARSLVRQALTNVQNAATPTQQSDVQLKKKQEDDAEKKRRRRSSLLRRSVSSSMLPNLMAAGREMELKAFDDKKKSSRKAGDNAGKSPDNSPINSRNSSPVPPDAQQQQKDQPRPAFGRSRSVELGGGRAARRLATKYTGPPIVKETLKMDVLLNTSKTALLPGADMHGNNRLRVMVNIQTAAYQSAADEAAKTKIAADLVNTIESFWGGRVLSLFPSMRGRRAGVKTDNEQYVKLEDDHAIQAMRNLLSGRAEEKEEEITIVDALGTNKNIKQGRRASLKAIQSIATVGVGGGSSTILPSSLPTLPADMQHLRSAAVKSLQKRKQRQGLNSRIRGLVADKAAIYQDGNTNASVTSSSVAPCIANVAPIPTHISSQVSRQHHPNMQHYRQTSSGASVASTVSGMSVAPPPGVSMQRQASISSHASSTTAMSMNTMNAARTMASINLNAHPSPLVQSTTMMNPVGMGGPVLGSELYIPNDNVPSNIMAPMVNQQQQMQRQQQQQQPTLQQQLQQLQKQQIQQQMQQQIPQQFQQRVSVGMPSVPEELNSSAFSPNPLSPEQLARLNEQFNRQEDIVGAGTVTGMERNSLLNSTGSDGLPKFGQGEMDLLINGLEMGDTNQQQQQP